MSINYKNKFLKYKEKNNRLLFGGRITQDEALLKICSIGFEFESGGITTLKCEGTQNPSIFNLIPITTDRINKITLYSAPSVDFKVSEDIADTQFDKIITDYLGANFGGEPQEDLIKIQFRGSDRKLTEFLIQNRSSYNKFNNTEFMITFTNIESSQNSILFYFRASCQLISAYFASLKEMRSLVLFKKGTSYTNADRPLRAILYDENNNLFYFPTDVNQVSEIKYTAQITVGVLYKDAYLLIDYLLQDTIHYDNAIDLYDLALVFSTDMKQYMLPGYEEECMTNWLFFVISKFVAYLKYDKKISQGTHSYIKYSLPFYVRHNFVEIRPFINTDEALRKLATNIISTEFLTMEDYKIIFGISNIEDQQRILAQFFDYLGRVCHDSDNVNKDASLPDPDVYSTKYPFNTDDKIVLIELRAFSKQLNSLLFEGKMMTHEKLEEIAKSS